LLPTSVSRTKRAGLGSQTIPVGLALVSEF